MLRVDLNSDLGESFGAYKLGQDEKILDIVTSANIACGYHAGDYNIMDLTVKMAIEKGVGIGAHPGFPDILGFGRRTMQFDPKEIYNFIVYQIGALQAFAKINSATLNHVKPHGALYNMATKDRLIAEAIAEAVYDVDYNLILFGLAGGELIKAGKKRGLLTAQEVFADRSYQPDGTLTPRSRSNAMIKDPEEAAHRVIRMVKEGKVEAIDGSEINIQAETICVHGDENSALLFVERLKQVLQDNNIEIKKVGS